MRHCRLDYEAIQPWPTQRPHWAKLDGSTVACGPFLADENDVDPIIPDDEPVFLLRSMDKLGPEFVRAWAAASRKEGGDPATAARVHEWASEMDAYAAAHGGPKTADTPPTFLRPSPDA